MYIDDKGVTFNGDWDSMLKVIDNFQTWKERCEDSNKKSVSGQKAS